MEKHSYSIKILEHHLDTFGHMNHAVYLTLFEEARWDLITGRGYGLKEVHACKEGPVVLSVNVRYLKEVLLRETVTIETRCTDYSRVVAELEQKMLKSDGSEAAVATLQFALMDLEKRKIIKPSAAWLKALGLSPM